MIWNGVMFRRQLGRAADSEFRHNDAHDRLQEEGDEKARLKPRYNKTVFSSAGWAPDNYLFR